MITGAPIERLDFDEVDYWGELVDVFDWTQTNILSTFAICWGAQAMLHYFHGAPKHALAEKAFGCFRHKTLAPSSPYLRGFSDDFTVPVSRWTEVRREDLPDDAGLQPLAASEETGLCLVEDSPRRALYMFNHIEYDTTSLAEEYERDVQAGKSISPPKNYFPQNDPSLPPENRWRSHAHLLFGNWINALYQSTPYDINMIGRRSGGDMSSQKRPRSALVG